MKCYDRWCGTYRRNSSNANRVGRWYLNKSFCTSAPYFSDLTFATPRIMFLLILFDFFIVLRYCTAASAIFNTTTAFFDYRSAVCDDGFDIPECIKARVQHSCLHRCRLHNSLSAVIWTYLPMQATTIFFAWSILYGVILSGTLQKPCFSTEISFLSKFWLLELDDRCTPFDGVKSIAPISPA